MGFWFFMMLMDLLIPATMIGFGRCFLKGFPKDVNGLFGYRTGMSMKNKDTWNFAHQYCGRLWYKSGLILLPVSVFVMLCVMGKDHDSVGTAGGFLCAVQMIPLVAVIYPTEKALRKNFDKDGNKRYSSEGNK